MRVIGLVSVVEIDVVVAPVLQSKEPVNTLAVKTEFPQLLVTVTIGADGTILGVARILAAALVQLLTFWVTE